MGFIDFAVDGFKRAAFIIGGIFLFLFGMTFFGVGLSGIDGFISIFETILGGVGALLGIIMLFYGSRKPRY